MYRQKADPWTFVLIFLCLNFISFTIVKFKKFKEKYHTFYQCREANITLEFNGKEYIDYRLKFEKIHKMSPDCVRID